MSSLSIPYLPFLDKAVMLEGSKARLLWERGALERKIEAVRSRAAEKEQKEKERVRLRETGMMGQSQGKDG